MSVINSTRMDDDASPKRRTRLSARLSTPFRPVVSAELRLEKFELFVLTGPDRGAHLPFVGSIATVGFGPLNDIKLADEAVSDRHLTIEETSTGILLKDVGSTNGTRVNDVPVREAYLKPGSDIVIGETIIRFQPKN